MLNLTKGHSSIQLLQHIQDVTKQLLDNPEHSIDFEHPEIITTALNLKELLIKESILISTA